MKPDKLQTTNYKLLILVGPTASGKSELAVRLAKRFYGEIVSADSRQIYKGMDLGTGKVAGKWIYTQIHGREREYKFVYKGVPHYQIDFQNPKRQYSAALFQLGAKKAIADILHRGKLPIICGGTGHWIDALAYNQQLPDVKPNPQLRSRLEKQSANLLFKRLKRLDPQRAKTIDPKNKHRLIRALEIILTTGKPVPQLVTRNPQLSNYQPFWIGINSTQTDLYQKINKRLHQRLKQGMIKEVSKLHNQGLSWKRLIGFGLEYKYISLYLQKKLSREEMLTQLSFAIKHYAKRQMTWWKRNREIIWAKPNKAAPLVKKFLG
jgi:tRNA dimethylallyltransferase